MRMFVCFVCLYYVQKAEASDERTIECQSCKLWVHDKCDRRTGAALKDRDVSLRCEDRC